VILEMKVDNGTLYVFMTKEFLDYKKVDSLF